MNKTIAKIELDLLRNMFHQREIIPIISEAIDYKVLQKDSKESRAVFYAMSTLWYEEKDINEISIENIAIKYTNNSDALTSAIEEIVGTKPVNHWQDDLEEIIENFTRTEVVTGCEIVTKMAKNRRIERNVIAEKLQDLSEIAAEEEQVEDMEDMLEKDDVIPIYHRTLSAMMAGVMRGDIFTIGGEAGMGKTTLAIELANSWSDAGYKVLFESIELTHNQLWRKLAARRTKIDSNWVTKRWNDFKAGKIGTKEDYNRFVDEIKYLKDNVNGKTLKVSSYSSSVTEIKLDARKFKPDILIVDWVQMMEMPSLSGSGGFTNMAQGIPEVLKSLKALSKRLNFATIPVAQVECNGKRPTISDFTDSKAFKKYSADIMTVYYHFQADPLTFTKNILELRQLKDRFGGSGKVAIVEFNREYGEIGDVVENGIKQDYQIKTRMGKTR